MSSVLQGRRTTDSGRSSIRLSTEHVQQRLDIKRFGHELHGLPVEHPRVIFAADGDDAPRALDVGEAHAVLEQFDTVHHRHAQVRQQDIKSLREQITQSFFAIAGGDNLGTGLADQPADRLPGGRMIFDNQNLQFSDFPSVSKPT